jgi:hypothetical protein
VPAARPERDVGGPGDGGDARGDPGNFFAIDDRPQLLAVAREFVAYLGDCRGRGRREFDLAARFERDRVAVAGQARHLTRLELRQPVEAPREGEQNVADAARFGEGQRPAGGAVEGELLELRADPEEVARFAATMEGVERVGQRQRLDIGQAG